MLFVQEHNASVDGKEYCSIEATAAAEVLPPAGTMCMGVLHAIDVRIYIVGT